MQCSVFRLAFLRNSVLETQISRFILKTFNTLLIYITKIHYLMLPRKFFDKNGAIWCILSVQKLVIINLKINIFFINQQSKFCTNFFSKINPDAHFGTKINTFTLKEDRGGGGGGGGGAIAPRS